MITGTGTRAIHRTVCSSGTSTTAAYSCMEDDTSTVVIRTEACSDTESSYDRAAYLCEDRIDKSDRVRAAKYAGIEHLSSVDRREQLQRSRQSERSDRAPVRGVRRIHRHSAKG